MSLKEIINKNLQNKSGVISIGYQTEHQLNIFLRNLKPYEYFEPITIKEIDDLVELKEKNKIYVINLNNIVCSKIPQFTSYTFLSDIYRKQIRKLSQNNIVISPSTYYFSPNSMNFKGMNLKGGNVVTYMSSLQMILSYKNKHTFNVNITKNRIGISNVDYEIHSLQEERKDKLKRILNVVQLSKK